MSDDHLERRVLAANVWPVFSYASGKDRYEAFLNRGRPAIKGLIESIILHDRITVPTEDYVTLTALVGVLGQRAIIELLEAGVLRFVRITGALAYVGNGGGVVHITIPYSGKEATPIGADVETAAKWSLSGFPEPVDQKLIKLVVGASDEVDLFAATKTIAARAYDDFRRLPFGRGLNPERLPGITGKQVQVLDGSAIDRVDDPIGGVLSIATANLELELMSRTGSLDLATSTPIGHALRAREIQAGLPQDKFASLREITDIPDVGELVISNTSLISELLRLREAKSGVEFRKWFHENCGDDPVAAARAYVDLLQTVPNIQSTPAKILRFLITNGIGFVPIVGPIVGTLSGIVDTFILDKIAERNGPKFFIEKLKQLDRTIRERGDA